MFEEANSTAAPAEVETVTPTEQVQTPESTAQTSGTEQTEVAEKAKDSAPKGDWVQRRIDQLTREKHEANRRAEEAEARATQRESQQTETQPATSLSPKEIDRAVEQRLKQRDFDSACNKVFEAGKSEFPDFDSSLKTFQMLGGAPVEFLEAVTSLKNGHQVLQHLGQDPDAASNLLSLPPLKMALELARLETSLGQAKPVSKAPAPITPIGSKSAPVEPSEFKSTADYIAWRKKNR